MEGTTLKEQVAKPTRDKGDCTKLKNILHGAGNNIQREETDHRLWKKIFASHTTDACWHPKYIRGPSNPVAGERTSKI